MTTAVEESTYTGGTGWQLGEEGHWQFFHATGHIDAYGLHPQVRWVSGPLAHYQLTAPTTTAADLRKQWDVGVGGFIDQVPDVAIPLIGAAYRAVVIPSDNSIGIVGPTAAFKSTIAAIVMHHFGTQWDRRTLNRTRSATPESAGHLTSLTQDVLVPIDDLCHEPGLAEVVRRFANRSGRTTGTQSMELRTSPGPAGSALITSEIRPSTASASQRLFAVEIGPGEITFDQIQELQRPESKSARNALMSTFVMWLSDDLDACRRELRRYQRELTVDLRDAGIDERSAHCAAELLSGWRLLLDFLIDRRVLSGDPRPMADRVRNSIVATAQRQGEQG